MKFSSYLFAFFPLLGSCSSSTDNDNPRYDTIYIEKDKPQSGTEVVEEPVREINLKGKWESKDNALYPIIEFKGKSTFVTYTILGSYVSSYERDEEFIRIKTDQSDLLFEVVSEDSIIGTGFAKGVWIRKKN